MITTAVGLSTIPKAGNPAPAALKMPRISLATPMPAKMPTIVAITGHHSASTTISRRTWRPAPPTARSRASSRSRWPIVMANTLLIRKALTKAVMKAKISSPVPIGPMNSLTLVVRLVDQRLLIDDLDVVGHLLGDALLDGGDVLALGDADVDGVVDALGAEHGGRRRRVPQGERGAAEAVGVAEADGSRQRERVPAGRRDDVDRSPTSRSLWSAVFLSIAT